MTGTPPARGPETWFQGKMRPRSEVERIKREEAAAQMAGPVEVETPPQEPAPMFAAGDLGDRGPGSGSNLLPVLCLRQMLPGMGGDPLPRG